MNLKELRGATPQATLLEVLKRVDKRVDIGLISKYENYIAMPTPPQLMALCDYLGVYPLDIYEPSEMYFDTSINNANLAKIKPNKRRKANVYKLTVRLDKEACKWLKSDVLAVCGYDSISQYIRNCVARLKEQYELRKQVEQQKAEQAIGQQKAKQQAKLEEPKQHKAEQQMAEQEKIARMLEHSSDKVVDSLTNVSITSMLQQNSEVVKEDNAK